MSIAEALLLLMLDYTTLTMQLWQFNSQFLKCCLSYRKISGSFSSTVRDIYILVGVCKTRTRYLRMADADGKMRIEKCGWKKNADSKKSKKKKNAKCGWYKKKINKQTIEERNLSFKSLSHG